MLLHHSHLTMTGFSDPATKPKPSSWSLSSVTVLGSGTSSVSEAVEAAHRRGSSYVVVLLRWLKKKFVDGKVAFVRPTHKDPCSISDIVQKWFRT